MKALNHEEADRVPSTEGTVDNLAICKYYGEKYVFQGIGKSIKRLWYLNFKSDRRLTKFLTKATQKKFFIRMALKRSIRLSQKIGLDFTGSPLALFPAEYFKNGYIDEYGRRMEYTINPSDGMDVGYYMGGAFKDFEEYEAFYNEHPMDPDNPIRENIYRIGKELEEKTKGKLYIMPLFVGMMEATWEGFGLENFSILLTKQKKIKKVFDDRGTFALEMVKRIIEWGEDGACYFFDDYGYKKGLFMSPRNYNKYVIPWVKRICDTAHKGGLKVILHSCGDILQIFEDLINAGVDGFNPIEPTTANPDYDIFKLKEKYGDKVTFIGNVSPQDLADKTPDYIREYSKKLIKDVAPGGGFIFCSGHSINPAIKLENFLAMRGTLEKYGRYPIKVD